jgi:hypothetical protein
VDEDDAALTRAICALLGRIPGWAYDPDPEAEPYPESVVGIYHGALQPTPDRAVAVRVYATSDDELAIRRAQIRFRGRKHDTFGADNLAKPAFLVLHGLSRVGGSPTPSRRSRRAGRRTPTRARP